MTPCIALNAPMALAEGQANRACVARVSRARFVPFGMQGKFVITG